MRINGSIIGSNVTPSFLSGATGVWSMQNVELANRQIIWPTDIVTNGLVLFLDANNTNSYPGSGTSWYDLSGNGNTGTLTNGPTFSSTNGGSIFFDGTNDYVNMGTSTYCNLINISVSVWVRVTSASGVFLGRYYNTTINGFFMYYDVASTKFSVDGRESSAAYLSRPTTNTYPLNNWYNVTWTKSANVWSLYVNGSLDVSSSIGNGTTPFSNNTMWLGGYNEGGAQYYSSVNLSNVFIYNRVLSANEVLQNYNAARARFGL